MGAHEKKKREKISASIKTFVVKLFSLCSLFFTFALLTWTARVGCSYFIESIENRKFAMVF